MLQQIKALFLILPNVGILPSDNDGIALRKRFMNSMALLMSNGGLLWGGISLYYEAYLQATIPLGYTLFTAINLLFFQLSKNFRVYRFLQVLMSLMLPFLFQWSLGGLIESGGMMLWSFLALVGSMSVQDVRDSMKWLVAFVALVILSGFIDKYFLPYSLQLSTEVHVWFFVVNVAFISPVIFLLTLYYIHSRNKANSELTELAQTLEQKVVERTTDLLESNQQLVSLNDRMQETLAQLREKSELVELKNKNITDSLNYAKRIQKAILANNEVACKKLNEHFVFFRPKDIVSGDFYWFHCDYDNNRFVAAVVDCTGHGVPGAFMSLIGESLLNQIVIDKGVFDPGQILTEMDLGIEKALKAEESHRRDGMDMAVVVFGENLRVVKYAGAKIPLVYVERGKAGMLKGAVHSIGGGAVKVQKVFETQELQLTQEAMIYLFTDGFTDQMGGHDSRKYLIRYFKQFLEGIAYLPAAEQRSLLKSEFYSWKGDNAQTDDTLVVGIRV